MRKMVLFLGGLMLLLASAVYAQDSISPGDTLEGTLDDNTAEFSFTGKTGELLVIELMSDDFDTVVTVLDADGNEIGRDDDGGDEGSNSRLAFLVPADGTYTLVAGGFLGEASGDFTLSLSGIKPAVVTYGSTTEGAGEGGAEYYTFEGKAGETVNIYAESDNDDDLRLDVTGPDGSAVANDDDSGQDFSPYIRLCHSRMRSRAVTA
jgi:hypothetical protein